MDKRLLPILHCPVTHKGLATATPATLMSVNAAIEAGQLRNRGGAVITNPFSDALLSDDGKILYPVADGIPVLLEGEAINMEQIA